MDKELELLPPLAKWLLYTRLQNSETPRLLYVDGIVFAVAN